MRATHRLAVAAVIAAVTLTAERAWAPFHIVVVDQVFFGTADCPNAQYVMMRQLAPQQRFINGQKVTTQNADGSAGGDFGTFGGNVPNGNAGDAYIMGTADAATLFGIAMDQQASGTLVLPDGRVCFGQFAGSAVDCLAYGNFTGDNTGGGSPAVAPQLGMAFVRHGNNLNGDDATDFSLEAPAPRNNAGQTGTLGQCSGGQPTPTATVPPSGACVGDCNDDHMVSIGEVITGVNIALGNAPVSSCEAFDPDGSGMVVIGELIQGVNNALSGCPS